MKGKKLYLKITNCIISFFLEGCFFLFIVFVFILLVGIFPGDDKTSYFNFHLLMRETFHVTLIYMQLTSNFNNFYF